MPRGGPNIVLDKSHRLRAIFDRVTVLYDTNPTFDDSLTTMELDSRSERLLFSVESLFKALPRSFLFSFALQASLVEVTAPGRNQVYFQSAE